MNRRTSGNKYSSITSGTQYISFTALKEFFEGHKSKQQKVTIVYQETGKVPARFNLPTAETLIFLKEHFRPIDTEYFTASYTTKSTARSVNYHFDLSAGPGMVHDTAVPTELRQTYPERKASLDVLLKRSYRR